MTSSGPAEIGLRQPWPEKLRDANFWADRAVALVALFAAFAATSPVFLTRGNIEALLLASAILMVLAVGQTIVIVTAGIDLSIGAVTQLASVMLGWSLARGWGVGAAIAVAVLTGVVVGAANGVIVAKGRITDFIVTLGSLSVATGLAPFSASVEG